MSRSSGCKLGGLNTRTPVDVFSQCGTCFWGLSILLRCPSLQQAQGKKTRRLTREYESDVFPSTGDTCINRCSTFPSTPLVRDSNWKECAELSGSVRRSGETQSPGMTAVLRAVVGGLDKPNCTVWNASYESVELDATSSVCIVDRQVQHVRVTVGY